MGVVVEIVRSLCRKVTRESSETDNMHIYIFVQKGSVAIDITVGSQ